MGSIINYEEKKHKTEKGKACRGDS